MTSINQATALHEFVQGARSLFASEPDPEKRWEALRPIFARLLADPAVVAASKKWPDCRFVDNRVDNLLFYEDPDYKFVINALVTSAGGFKNVTTTIHDHGDIYTLFGLLDGTQRIERYERVDDRSKPGHAEIRKTFDSKCGPGEMDFVRPFEIHSDDTMGERSVAIIIRSERSDEIPVGRYQPEKNSCWEAPGPRQIKVSFYSEGP